MLQGQDGLRALCSTCGSAHLVEQGGQQAVLDVMQFAINMRDFTGGLGMFQEEERRKRRQARCCQQTNAH